MENIKIDPNGFWDRRNIENGKVIIPSNRITMKGVNFPVLGVSDTGDMKVMLPNGEYKFNGNNVTEYKMKNGGKTTIGNTSFDVMESFKKLVLSPEYATQVDNSQHVMQDGGEDDEKEKNPWLNAVDSIRLQDLQPLETYQYVGRIRKNEKQLEEQNVWKNNINDYNNQKSILDSYQTAYDKSDKDIGLLLNPEYSPGYSNYKTLDNFYNSEEAINNISNQFYGSTIGLNNINIGTLGKNIIDGNVEYPEIQTTKPRTWAKINWQGVDNLGSTFVNLLNNYGNWREARQKENLSPVETQAAVVGPYGNMNYGAGYTFNVIANSYPQEQTEIENQGDVITNTVKYGGRCFDEGGQYDNVTPEELDYLIKNGIKFHF